MKEAGCNCCAPEVPESPPEYYHNHPTRPGQVPTNYYGNIERGLPLTIPVVIRTHWNRPVNLTGYELYFVIKKARSDDVVLSKKFTPQNPEKGAFFVSLIADDTMLELGDYRFEIQSFHTLSGIFTRLTDMKFTLTGRKGVEERQKIGETITVVISAMDQQVDIYGELAQVKNSLAKLALFIKENGFTLPVATEDILGGIKASETLKVAETGTAEVNVATDEEVIAMLDAVLGRLDEEAIKNPVTE